MHVIGTFDSMSPFDNRCSMCGFVGMVSPAGVGSEIHLALQAIQHRGQDSAGAATMEADGSRFHVRRGKCRC